MTSRVSTADVFERDAPLFVESATGRLPKYPRLWWTRWGLRLLIAAAYSGLAIWFNTAGGGDWSGTANAALAERVHALRFDTSGVEVIGQIYPPITSLAALLIPGGALGLSIAGAIVAAFMVQLLIQAQQRKGFHPIVRAVFTITLATTPMYTFVVTTNFEAAVGLMFFGLGMLDLVRFVTYANTQAGFRAGILFACSAFSDSNLVFSALVAAIGGALLIQSRRKARFANAVVVAFPTLALFAALALLGTAFGSGPFAMIRGSLSWDPVRAETYVGIFATPLGWLYLAPIAVIVVTAIALRFPLTGLIAVLLAGSTALSYILGLAPPGSSGTTFVLLLLVAVAIVPSSTTTAHRVLTSATALVLWAIGWMTAFASAVVLAWMQTLGGTGS